MGLIQCSGTHFLRRGLIELRGSLCQESPGKPLRVNARLLVGFLQGLVWSRGNSWVSEGTDSEHRC